MSAWHDFFVAQAGVAGALIGLLFVAVSINLTRILAYAQLPTRAAETLVLFFIVLVVAAIALVPDQGSRRAGGEILIAGTIAWLLQLASLVRTRAADRVFDKRLRRLLLNQLPPLPFIGAGAAMLAGYPAGAIWLLPGTLLCFAAGVFGAWVLLIEIQR